MELPGETGIERILLALFAGLPAIIAAISSLKNGQEQKRVRRELQATNHRLSSASRKRSNKRAGGADGNTASDPDWYKPPEL